MAIHVDFIAGRDGKEYTFLDRHTNLEIAFGTYGPDGFEMIGTVTNGIETHASAAVAWTDLNVRLQRQYGY